jgi:hypothetical protein
MFSVRRLLKGKTYYVLLHVKGGTEMELTTEETEVWLSGYITGQRAQIDKYEREEMVNEALEAQVEANKRGNEIVSVEVLAEG